LREAEEENMKLRVLYMVLVVLMLGSVAHAKVVTQRVPYQHENVALEGYLAYDDSIQGKRAGVLVVHEWWGLNDYARKRAEQLAGLGYVAFALDMYGKGKVTTHPQEAGEWSEQIASNVELWGQRALAGLKVLENDPRVDPNRMAAIGYCFGGSTVQQLAYLGVPLKGVVSFHGSLLAPTEEQAKKVKAKILICQSGLDWQMSIFGGAKHSFTNPDADKMGMDALRYSKSADKRSWMYMKDFFKEIFSSK
jgi:dienelactone hydrolase